MSELEAVGIDAQTGRVLRGWDHVLQSTNRLFSTSHFSRVMRPHVGTFVPRLLGALVNPRQVQRFRWAVSMGLLLFEPRFAPTRVDLVALDRTGRTGWIIEGVYYPRGHKGDFTGGERRSIDLSGLFADGAGG